MKPLVKKNGQCVLSNGATGDWTIEMIQSNVHNKDTKEQELSVCFMEVSVEEIRRILVSLGSSGSLI